jgi:hypothetical protein
MFMSRTYRELHPWLSAIRTSFETKRLSESCVCVLRVSQECFALFFHFVCSTHAFVGVSSLQCDKRTVLVLIVIVTFSFRARAHTHTHTHTHTLSWSVTNSCVIQYHDLCHFSVGYCTTVAVFRAVVLKLCWFAVLYKTYTNFLAHFVYKIKNILIYL